MKFKKNYPSPTESEADVDTPGYCPYFSRYMVVPSTLLMKDEPRSYLDVPTHYDHKANDTDSDWDMVDSEVSLEKHHRNQDTMDLEAQSEIDSVASGHPGDVVPKELVELRLSRPPVVISPIQTNKKKDEMDIGSTNDRCKMASRISHSLTKHTSLLPFSNHVFHCSNTWDLFLCLNRMTPTQRSIINTLKIRWRDAIGLNWELGAQKTGGASTKAYAMLAGLEVLIIDANEQLKREAEDVRQGVEKWVDGVLEGVVVKIEGETVEKPVPEPKGKNSQAQGKNKGKGKWNGNRNGNGFGKNKDKDKDKGKDKGKGKKKWKFFQSSEEDNGGSTKEIYGWTTERE